MTYEEVMRLYLEYLAADEEHACPGEEFVTCEICARARQAHDRLIFHVMDIVMLLEREKEAKDWLTRRVIQDVEIEQRTPELQQAMLHALKLNQESKGLR